MKNRILSLLIALLVTASFQARGDDSTPQSSGATDSTSSEKGQGDDGSAGEQSSFPEIDGLGTSVKPVRPDKPDGESSAKRDAIKQLTEAFKQKAAEFHQKQLDLAKSLSEASREDRAKIRDEMKANREAFAQIKDEFRDQVRDVVSKLKDQKQKIDDETKDKQTDRRGGKTRA
ncbi:MAG TPA: hypothetical protein VGR78_17215 [Verrucomicrobiae bacterium]|jgi:hypothetical protein|nr:hypothetical protein [Verrucomicrobiae bacterium]